jgi:hypothetical protein
VARFPSAPALFPCFRSVPYQIKQRKKHKLRAVDQGAAPNCAGFVQQAPEPFQSHSAGPARRRHHLAAMKLDGGADGDDYGVDWQVKEEKFQPTSMRS